MDNSKFKCTKLGFIPTEWDTCELQDISGFITKGATPTTYGFDWMDEGVYFFKSDCVKDGKFVFGDYKFISEEAHDSMQRSKVKHGDLLLSITGDLGKIARIPDEIEEANINQHVAKIDVVSEVMDDEFVFQWLNRSEVQKYYNLIKTGLAYPQISLKQVRETIIPVPPLPEQKKIAKILSTVDGHIDEVDGMIEDLKELKKGLMQKLLTEGIGHTEFKDSEVGRIPVGWEVYKLGTVSDFRQGFQIPRSEQIEKLREGYERYLYISDFFSNKNTLYIKTSSKYYRISVKDICIANTGNTCGKSFRGAEGILSNNMFKIFPNNDYIVEEYYWHYLQSEFYWKQLRSLFNSAGQPHVGHKNMSELNIALPSVEEQRNIVKILDSIDERIQLFTQEGIDLKYTKKGLMQQLLTGRTRVEVVN